MAVVRFSDELKSAIVDNAKRLFEKRINAQISAVPAIGDEVAELVFRDLIATMHGIPKGFLRWNNNIEITVRRNGMSVSASYSKLRTDYPKPDANITLSDGVVLKAFYSTEIILPDTPKYATYFDQLFAWQDGVNAITQQRDDFVAGVKKVVEAHATLAPALKAWPPLWDLVPDAYKERHRKVVERAKPAAPAELDVDLTSLTTTVVTSKIMGK